MTIKNKKHPDVGKWVITYVMEPYPTNVGKIVHVYFGSDGDIKGYEIEFPYGHEIWKANKCKVFKTEKEAQKEYDNFTTNKNNYAYEG